MIVDRIVESVKERLENRKRVIPLPLLRTAAEERDDIRDFKGSLETGDCAVIAEIKRASPSAGRIIDDFDPAGRAAACERGGAAALSVLTEEDYFEGSLAHLVETREAVSLPVLRKDFIIDAYQVYETRAAGGDALLLLAGLLGRSELADFLVLAGSLGMEALVEVRNERELEEAIIVGAGVVGINNRDLKTFRVDIATSEYLAPLVPPAVCVVAESGIRDRADMERLRAAGIKAFLVGEALSRSKDPGAELQRLMAGKDGEGCR